MALDADGPTLDTDRLRLRPPRLDNLRWSHARISSDPRVAWDSESSTIIESLKGLENRIAHWREHGFGMWAVIEKACDEPLGFAGLVALEGTDEVQVGYHLEGVEQRLRHRSGTGVLALRFRGAGAFPRGGGCAARERSVAAGTVEARPDARA